MIVVLQFIAIIFALSMIYFALLHYRRGELVGLEMFVWLLLWIAAIIIVVFPDILRTFARTFLFARLFDLVIVGGLLLAVIIASRAYIATKRMEKKIEDYVRRDTLKDLKSKKK